MPGVTIIASALYFTFLEFRWLKGQVYVCIELKYIIALCAFPIPLKDYGIQY